MAWQAFLCATSVILVAPALAVADSAQFHINAQPLPQALKAFAAQAQMQLLYQFDTVRHLKGNPVEGDLEKHAALQRLLEGTGLEVVYGDDDDATIRPIHPTPKTNSTEDNRSSNINSSTEHEGAATRNRLQLAQELPRETTTVEQGSTQPSQQSPRAFEEIAEVVVTAQKRAEKLQDVPISIAVLSGKTLDTSPIQGTTEALSQVAGVTVYEQFQGGGTQVTIRGAAAASPAEGGSSPVAYYLDTVPFGFIRNSFEPDANAYDLDRVEVLRGPQSTLYGASALNGVVRVLTNDADLHHFEVKARVSGSDTDGGGGNYRGDIAVNVPIIDGKLAARLVLGDQKVSGWIDAPNLNKTDVNYGNIRNYRLKINSQPIDALSIGLSAWRSDASFGAPSVSNDNNEQTTLLAQPVSTVYDAYGLKIAYDFSWATLSSATSYLDYSNLDTLGLGGGVLFPGPPSPLFTDHESRLNSEELLLSSKGDGPWRWSLGAFLRYDKDQWFANLPGVGWLAPLNYYDRSRSEAIYGEVTRNFLEDKLELTVGIRQFHDNVGTIVKTLFVGGYIPVQDFSFTHASPRAVLTWKPSAEWTVYGSYGEGFRSGVAQLPQVTAVAPNLAATRPDTLKNYEIGTKGNLWDGHLSFDAAAYYVVWRDTQQSLEIPVPGGTFSQALVNSTGVSGPGLEFGIAARVLQDLELGLTFGWSDLTFDQDVYSSGLLLWGKGTPLNLTSKYTGSANAAYHFRLGSGGFEGKLTASASYSSATQNVEIEGTARDFVPGDNIVIVRSGFSVESPGHRWTGTLFVDNLTNERGTVIRNAQSPDWSSHVRPRTIGLQLEHNFAD